MSVVIALKSETLFAALISKIPYVIVQAYATWCSMVSHLSHPRAYYCVFYMLITIQKTLRCFHTVLDEKVAMPDY